MHRRRSSIPAALLAVVVGVAAFGWFDRRIPTILLGDDTTYSQLLARDCAELGHCHLIGASASLPGGFYHGALWIDSLTAVRLLGGDASSARVLALGSMALAAVTLFIVTWRWLHPIIALPAVVLFSAALGYDNSAGTLIVQSASFLPDVLTAAGLLCYALSRQPRFLFASALALGLAISAHLGSLTLFPSLLMIAAIVHPRPLRGVFSAATIAGGVYFLTSRGALLANLTAVVELRWHIPILVGLSAIILAAMGFGSRFRRLPPVGRAWATGLLLLLPFGVLSFWFVVWQRHAISITFLHSSLAPAATLVATALTLPLLPCTRHSIFLRSAAAVAALMVIVVGATELVNYANASLPPDSSYWSYEDAKAILKESQRRGWEYEDLLFHVQGRACRELVTAIAIDAPPPTGDRAHPRQQLQIVKMAREKSAHFTGSELVPLELGQVAVIREVASWLVPEAAVGCRHRPDSGGGRDCAPPLPTNPSLLTPQFFSFRTRAAPAINHAAWDPPYVTEYEIPIAAIDHGSRDVMLIDDASPTCGWHVTRVEGLRVEGTLPAKRVRLHSDGQPGLLVLEKSFGSPECGSSGGDNGYPPCFFESEPNDPLALLLERHLHESLRKGSSPSGRGQVRGS